MLKWKKRILIILGMLMLSIGSVVCASEKKVGEEGTFPYSMVFNLIEYTGEYSGEIQQNVPHGNGRFVTDEDSPEQFIYEGAFKEGTFWGKGTVIYEDTLTLTGKFKEGIPEGKCTITYMDGIYIKAKYSQGVLEGIATKYSENGEYLGYDFFYQGELVSELKTVAKTVSYRSFYKDETELYGDVIQIPCTVDAVYELKNTRVIKFRDDNDRLYWGEYANGEYREFSQSFIPQLEKGERVTLYGFYKGLSTFPDNYDDSEGGNLLPFILPIAVDTEKDDAVDREDPSFSYAKVCRNPYGYYDLKNVMRGTIKAVIAGSGNNRWLEFVSDNNNVYYISKYLYKDGYRPVPGDRIKVRVCYQGLYKVLDEKTDTYKVYPRVKAVSIKREN